MGVRGALPGGSWLALAATALSAVTGCAPGSAERSSPAVHTQRRGFALPSWSTGDYGGPHAAAYVKANAALALRIRLVAQSVESSGTGPS